jgi:hypothetical protein
MPLVTGARLGPYEVVRLLGRGGMGEVYLARDTRLNRDVALKVLPPGLAADPVRRARFEREAQAIARLSHPNICALYDVGDTDGVVFLVMEYIDGESLDDRLRRGPIPWRLALPWAIQMTSAIDTAHRHSIVHRDLKPSNVMVSEAGIKLLDFGVAKLVVEADPAPAVEAEVQASTASLTGEQKIVGTLRYMAPEQLEGRPVDSRADIFAFGATLYEVLTGRRAFDGTSSASVTAQILTSDPPPLSASAMGKNVPLAFNHIVRRALAKDPADRWQTARDVMIELQWVQDGRSGEASAPAAAPRRLRRTLVTALMLAGGIGALAAWPFYSWAARGRAADGRSEPTDVYEIMAPDGTVFSPGYGLLATSPDGRKIAFLAGPPGARQEQIYVRDLAVPEARPISETAGALNLFWSPDSRSIGYFTPRRQIMRVDLADQKRTELAVYPVAGRLTGNPFGVWPRPDTILVAYLDELYQVNAAGGPLTSVVTGSVGFFPSRLSASRFMTLLRGPGAEVSELVVRSLDRPGQATRVTLPVQSNAVAVGGYLVYRRQEALVAQAFDDQALRLSGNPVTLALGVQFNPGNERTVFDVSGDLLAYRRPLPPKLVWKSRDGHPLGSIGESGEFYNPAIAPDGSGRVAVDRFDPAASRFTIATIDAAGRLTAVSHGVRDRFPVWSPQGEWLVSLGDPPQSRLSRTHSDGSGGEEALLVSDSTGPRPFPLDWSPDGRYLLYETGTPGDLWALPLSAPRTPIPVTARSGGARSGRFSPDGRWVAYAVSVDGISSIWVQAFPSGDFKRRISPDQGFDPSWRADGKELYYMTETGTLMVVPVLLGGGFASGPPVALFETHPGNITLYQHLYAASRDGQRFLVTELANLPDRITVVRHWTALVR